MPKAHPTFDDEGERILSPATVRANRRKLRTMRKRFAKKNWLIMHAAHERALSVPIRDQFERQGTRFARMVENGSPLNFVLESFSVAKETDELLEVLAPKLQRAMIIGAASMHESLAVEKWFGGADLSTFSMDLPPGIVAGIRSAMKDLLKQPWWQEIASWSKRNLATIIDRGIADGASNKEIAKAIRDASKGNLAKKRALVIARSEATGALNAGHAATLDDLAQHDPTAKKRWSAISDDRTRDSHLALNGESVPVDEKFSNGGRWPGDCFLPAAERANCRCVLVGDVSLI